MITAELSFYAYLNSTWTDITADVIYNSASAEWGMSGNKPLDKLARSGSMRFSLKNNTGKYTPGGSGVIHADWKRGAKVYAEFTYDGQTYRRFYGTVNTIQIDAGTKGERKAHVTILDWMDYAANHPIDNPAVELDKRADEGIESILANMPIQPLATSIDTGSVIFPTIFSDATLKTKAYSEFHKFIMSEFGSYLYLLKDKDNGETLRFESANSRAANSTIKRVLVAGEPGYLLQENGDRLLQENGDDLLIESYAMQDVEVDNSMRSMRVVYGDNLINRVRVSANPVNIATKDTLLFNLDSAIKLDVGEVKDFFVQFTEEQSKRLVAALPPDTNYPTTLLHFDEALNGEELIKEEGGKHFDDVYVSLVQNVKKIGAASCYFDGGGGWVRGTSSTDYEFGSGDFTVEWWEYRFNADANEAVVSRGDGSGYVSWSFGKSNGSTSLIYITSNGTSWDIANGKSLGAIPIATWSHCAVVRSGHTFFAWRDGELTDTWTSSATILASTDNLAIGKTGSNYITACIDEFRIVKGYAAYTKAFTPSEEPFELSGLVYSAWTNENGTGTEITPDVTIDVVYGAAGANVIVENTGSAAGWLTTLRILGKIVESISPITDVQEDDESISDYGTQELSIDQKYQADFVSGREEGAKILDAEKEPRIDIINVGMNANRDAAHMAYFLNVDVGDVVRIVEDQIETSALFHVQGVGWSAVKGAAGVVVDYNWTVKKFREDLSPIGLEFGSIGSSVDFGYLPQISNVNKPHRVVSAWVYRSVDSGSGVIFDFSTDGQIGDLAGILQFHSVFPYINKQLRIHAKWSGNSGYTIWATDSLTVFDNTSQWYHALMAYDTSSPLNIPRLWVDGVELTLTLIQNTPVGTIESDYQKHFVVGRASQFSQIKDPRVYDGDAVSPSALAAGLYAEGAGGDAYKTGLLFRGFYAPLARLAYYEGASLTESQKIVEDVSFATGTPRKSPVGVAI